MIDASVPTQCASTSVTSVTSVDPLARVLELGAHARKWTILRACVGAVFLHTAMAEGSLLRERAEVARHADEVQELSIEEPPEPVKEPPLPEPPPPPEPPKADPNIVAAAPPEPEPEEEEAKEEEPPSSEAAQASEVLTQEDDEADDTDDDDDNTIVTGDSDKFAGGMTAANGTSLAAVRGSIAAVGGVPGGTGTQVPAVPPPRAPNDKSRKAWLLGSNWDCDFPGEADRDEINHAAVELQVVVRPNGTPQDVKVLDDPGHGFARTAAACALKRTFLPARDKDGNLIWGTTPPFHVGFHR